MEQLKVIGTEDDVLVLVTESGDRFSLAVDDGYAALRALDSNGDGQITAADGVYGALRVWVDSNSDGISDAAELKTLAQLHIQQLQLKVAAGGQNKDGNIVGMTSSYTTTDGATHQAADVWFATGSAAPVGQQHPAAASVSGPPLKTRPSSTRRPRASKHSRRSQLQSGAASAGADPLVQHRFGQLWLKLRPASVLADHAAQELERLFRLGAAVTAQQRGELAISVAEAKVLAHQAGVDVSNQIFELTGARSTSAKFGYDRFWRNVRVHTLHDPVDYKIRDLGRYALDGTLPEPTAYS